jgi:hypothetical protein
MATCEEDSSILSKYPGGSIAMMNIKIHDRYSTQPALQKIGRRHRKVIEEAEAHGPIRFRMMPRGTKRTEGAGEVPR